MNQLLDKVQEESNHLYRSHYGKMVAWLLYFSSDIDLETAEDIVHDAFTSAIISWRNDGIPSNPAGWIFIVCRNKALNKIKEKKRITGISAGAALHSEELEFSESVLNDQQLKLLFACAHPDLSPKTQVIITLKYVVNLKVEAIASVFGMTIDGIDKILVRARQKIRNEKILLAVPNINALKSRLPIIHKIIYLIYNEGYKSSSGKEILREELCEEALLMNKELLDQNLANHETAALHALMLFNAARFKARFGPQGELRDLEEQDRSLWNKNLIALGCEFMERARGGIVSTYHFEASIAYLHCRESDFRNTDWNSISKLYFHLLKINPNPFVELSYAIALYYAGQKQKAISILKGLSEKPFLNQYYLLNATMAKIYFLEKNFKLARLFYEKTLRQTNLRAEKDFILKMIGRINDAEKQHGDG